MHYSFLKNYKLHNLALILLYILLLLMLGIRIFEHRKLQEEKRTIAERGENFNERHSLLSNLRKKIDSIHIATINYLSYKNGLEKEALKIKILNAWAENGINIDEYEKTIADAKEKELFKSLDTAGKIYYNGLSLLLKKEDSIKRLSPFRQGSHYLFKFYEIYQAALSKIVNYEHDRDEELEAKESAQMFSYETPSYTLSFILFILFIGLVTLINYLILRSRKAHRLLSENERKYRNLIEQTTEIIYSLALDGKFISANKTFKEKLGYTDHELSSLNLKELIEPESQFMFDYNTIKNKNDEVLKGIQQIVKGKDRKKYILEGNIIFNYCNNVVESTTAFFNDITEKVTTQKELIASEERYRLLFDFAPIPIWIINTQTLAFNNVNKKAINFLGYSEKELLRLSLLDITFVDDKERLKAFLNNDTQNSFHYLAPCRQIKKTGEKVEVDLYVANILMDNTIKNLVFAVDITEKNLYEQKLNRAIIKAQEEERYQIGAELHDNVCQILATIKITLDVIRPSVNNDARPLFEKTHQYLKFATDETRNLSHRLAPVFIEGSSFIKAFQQLLRDFNVGNKYDLNIEIDEAISNLTILPDLQVNLYRVLQEQLRNIFKYSEATSIELNLFEKNNILYMIIADNGKGFNPDKIEDGIGLANMQRRIKMFNGSFKIISAEGSGCTIFISIPLLSLN